MRVGLALGSLVHNGILVIKQGCIGNGKQGLWIGLID